ncbi:hypothetical protein CS537_13495 [Yersinia mollaretii]|nr:hypothetical protein CS537_13495 [Yersinia mollaretii]
MKIRTPAWPAVLMLLTSSFFLFLWQFKTSSRSRYMNSVLMAAPYKAQNPRSLTDINSPSDNSHDN